MAAPEFKRTESLTKCIQNIIQSEKVDKIAVLFKAHKTLKKCDVKKMKIGFWVEQWVYALFECQEDVNEKTKNHTKAVSGDCVISLLLRKLILGFT